jgi:hypothetical protein
VREGGGKIGLTKNIYLISFKYGALDMQQPTKVKFADYIFCFNEEKNKKLKFERGIGFEEIICILQAGLELDIVEHHNKIKYPNQKIFVVEKDNYIYAVPYVERDNQIFLKTIFPNRELREKYLNKRRSEKYECEKDT